MPNSLPMAAPLAAGLERPTVYFIRWMQELPGELYRGAEIPTELAKLLPVDR